MKEAKTKDWRRGLSREEVRAERRAGNENSAAKAPSKTLGQIIAGNVFTYFNFVFLVIAVLLFMVESYRDLTFLPIIITNTLIGIIQEARAKVALDRLMILNAPVATVVREGRKQRILAEKLVRGDVVVFGAGKQICADAEVLEGEIAVNEALLTGEAKDIPKKAGDELLSGSFVVSGECFARLTKVGKESYVSQLTLEAKKIRRREESEIIRALNRIVALAGVVIIPIGAVLFFQRYFGDGAGAQASVQSMVGAVIGLIPEGLFLLSSVALALSAWKLATEKVLPQNMKSIETLARVDVLCVDKTGTITEDKMAVAEIMPIGKNTVDELALALGDFAKAQRNDNRTMATLKEHFLKTSGRKAVAVANFSSELKYSGVDWGDGGQILGAPEFVLGAGFKKFRKQIEEASEKGYRVLAFGDYGGVVRTGEQLTEPIRLRALILLENRIRKEAPETFRYFAEQGVAIKVISGDNPRTVAEVAQKAGIAGVENYIDMSLVGGERELKRAALKYTVFGRVKPAQKRQLIKALQSAGRTVAMTGDGVNDILALKDADCSIAMASGSEAAAQVAQLVLLESDFSKMPAVVAEGRRVVNSLERSGSLFLVKNIFSLITSLLAISFSIAYPLVPAQVSLVSLFTIGMPAFLLSQMPNRELIRGDFMRNILRRATPGGVTDAVMVALVMLAGHTLGLAHREMSTIATIVIAVIGLAMVYRASRPLDTLKWAVLATCTLGLTASYVFLPDFFGMGRMGMTGWLLTAGVVVLSPVVLRYVTRASERFWRRIEAKQNPRKVRGD